MAETAERASATSTTTFIANKKKKKVPKKKTFSSEKIETPPRPPAGRVNVKAYQSPVENGRRIQSELRAQARVHARQLLLGRRRSSDHSDDADRAMDAKEIFDMVQWDVNGDDADLIKREFEDWLELFIQEENERRLEES
jgi:hypothetical protein